MEEPTAALLLGASKYMDQPAYSNRAFRNSKVEFKSYLHGVAPYGLSLPGDAVLDLFESRRDPGTQLREIGEFVERFRSAHTNVSRNLIIYYVGHGYFVGKNRDFYLALASAHPRVPDATGLRLASLGDLLGTYSSGFRIFYILDCCFAGEALSALQSGIDAVAQLANHSLHVGGPRRETDIPKSGSALLCATSRDDIAQAPIELGRTVFSGALLDVLKSGDAAHHARMTMAELGVLVWDRIRKVHHDKPIYQVRPVVHAPDQRDGDVSTHIELFPNPAAFRTEVDGGGAGWTQGSLGAREVLREPPSASHELRERRSLMLRGGIVAGAVMMAFMLLSTPVFDVIWWILGKLALRADPYQLDAGYVACSFAGSMASGGWCWNRAMRRRQWTPCAATSEMRAILVAGVFFGASTWWTWWHFGRGEIWLAFLALLVTSALSALAGMFSGFANRAGPKRRAVIILLWLGTFIGCVIAVTLNAWEFGFEADRAAAPQMIALEYILAQGQFLAGEKITEWTGAGGDLSEYIRIGSYFAIEAVIMFWCISGAFLVESWLSRSDWKGDKWRPQRPE